LAVPVFLTREANRAFQINQRRRNMNVIISFIIGVVIAALVLMVVSRFNLGLKVAGFGPAVIAAIVISLVSSVVLWLLSLLNISIGGGLLGLIVWLVIAAVVLLIAGRMLPGLTVEGFVGAIIAAVAIAAIYWLLTLIFPGLVSPLPPAP
jgi:putative membrane protein